MINLSVEELVMVNGGSCECICQSPPGAFTADTNMGDVQDSEICSNRCRAKGPNWEMRSCKSNCTIL